MHLKTKHADGRHRVARLQDKWVVIRIKLDDLLAKHRKNIFATQFEVFFDFLKNFSESSCSGGYSGRPRELQSLWYCQKPSSTFDF